MTNSYLFENVTVKTSVIIVNQQQNVSYRYFAHFKFANVFFFSLKLSCENLKTWGFCANVLKSEYNQIIR